MKRAWNNPDREPTPEQLAAWVDGELDPLDAPFVEDWLAAHPEAAAQFDGLRQIVRLYHDHSAPEPSAVAWSGVLEGIENRLAQVPAHPAWGWKRRIRFIVGVLATSAALVSGVVLAQSFWSIRPAAVSQSGKSIESVGDEEPFAVALASEVNIIRMRAIDADRIVLGEPLMGTFDLATEEDIDVVQVEPDWQEGTMPRLERRAGFPLVVVARLQEEP